MIRHPIDSEDSGSPVRKSVCPEHHIFWMSQTKSQATPSLFCLYWPFSTASVSQAFRFIFSFFNLFKREWAAHGRVLQRVSTISRVLNVSMFLRFRILSEALSLSGKEPLKRSSNGWFRDFDGDHGIWFVNGTPSQSGTHDRGFIFV